MGLFIGLTTYDTIYQVRHPPHADEKIVATQLTTAAGGPATGAAVTFAHLGGRAVLLSAVGTGPLAQAVRADLATAEVTHLDLRPGEAILPVSAIMVSSPSGQRAVVSAHAPQPDAPPLDRPPVAVTVTPACEAAKALLSQASVVLVDGHQPAAALEVLTALADDRATPGAGRRPPVILDAGSWKPGTDLLLSHLDVAIAGATFRPPGAASGSPPTAPADGEDVVADTLRYLLTRGPSFAAVTAGSDPIRWADGAGSGAIHPPAVQAVDTLGAGDVLHGAFAWALARAATSAHASGGAGATGSADLVAALTVAAQVASTSVTSFGTRAWMRRPTPST